MLREVQQQTEKRIMPQIDQLSQTSQRLSTAILEKRKIAIEMAEATKTDVL